MRAILLFLMVALLPLRMWAAEGMAVRMAHEQLQAAASIEAAMPSMPDDCPMSVQGNDADAPAGTQAGAGGHCSTCHLCAAAAFPAQAARAATPLPTGPPQGSRSRYLDAQLTPDLRPPIA
jgi:hypothetical protein